MIKLLIVRQVEVRLLTSHKAGPDLIGSFRASKEVEVPAILPQMKVSWGEGARSQIEINEKRLVYDVITKTFIHSDLRYGVHRDTPTLPTVEYRKAGWEVSDVELS